MIRLKNEKQMNGIRNSCKLLSELFAALKPMVHEGVSTGDMDHFARSFIEARHGKPAFLGYQGFPASLCLSINEEVIHGIPGKRRLCTGDIVGIDCGIELDGYFSDAAISLPVGVISAEAERLMNVTRECLDRAIKVIHPGCRVHEISRSVFSHAKANGFGVVHQYCGHGVGFSQHEDPQIPNYVGSGPNPRIVPGMVLAIEPMINIGTGDIRVLSDDWTVVTLDGKLSAHFEHTVAVFADHVEIMTVW